MPLDLTVPAVKNATKRAHYLRLLNNILALQSENFLTQSFRGLALMTHPDQALAPSRVWLDRADCIVMHDGTRVETWADLVADITASGAGGLDTGTEQASTWYEIYAIRKSSDGTKNLLLHRAKDHFADANYAATVDASRALRLATSTATDKLAQSFACGMTGLLEFVDIAFSKNGSPASSSIWFTLEADSAGNPSGTPLATSDKLDVSVLTTGAVYTRVVFRTPASLTSGTTYWLVLQGDFTRSDTNNAIWRGTVANGYASGAAKEYNGSVWAAASGVADFDFKTYVTRNDTSVASFLPTGYDQYARVGWVYNDGSSNFVRFTARDRLVQISYTSIVGALSNTAPNVVLLSAVIPPVPVWLLPMLFQGSAADTFVEMGGVPNGYMGASGNNPTRANAAVSTANANTTLAGFATEYQGAYVSRVSGTGTMTVFANGYVW